MAYLFINIWWAKFLLMGFVDRAISRMGDGDTLLDLRLTAGACIVSYAISLIAALLAIRVVRGVQERQDTTAKRLGLA